MSNGRKIVWVIAMIVILNTTIGCASGHMRSLDEEIGRSGTGLFDESGQEVNGYVLVDGTTVEYKGRAQVVEQDTIRFWRIAYENSFVTDDFTEAIEVPGSVYPRTAVKDLDVVSTSAGKTTLAIAGVLVGLVGLMAIAYTGPF